MDGVTMGGVTMGGVLMVDVAMVDVAMADGNPPQLFRRMMVTKLRQSLAAVQSAPQFLPTQVRDQALHILSYGLKDDPLASDASWLVARDLLSKMAPRMELMGHRYDWVPFLEKGIEIAQRFDEISRVAEYQLHLGILYRLLSKFDEAKQIVRVSITNFALIGDRNGEARSLNELAWIEHLTHDYDLADTNATHALQISGENAPERGMSFRTLGMIAYYQGKLDIAENYHRQALTIFETIGDEQKSAWCLQNIGMVLRQRSQFEEAISYFKRATVILEKLDDKSRWGMTQIGLGLAYYNAGNLLQAHDCYLRANTVAERLHDRLQMAMIQGNLALIYVAQSDYAKATPHFTSAINLYEQVGDKVWSLYNMEGLASCYIKQKKYKEAREMLLKIRHELPQISTSPYYKSLCQLIDEHWDFLQNA